MLGASCARLDAAHCRAFTSCASNPPEVPAYREAIVMFCFAVLIPACNAQDIHHRIGVSTKEYPLPTGNWTISYLNFRERLLYVPEGSHGSLMGFEEYRCRLLNSHGLSLS